MYTIVLANMQSGAKLLVALLFFADFIDKGDEEDDIVLINSGIKAAISDFPFRFL